MKAVIKRFFSTLVVMLITLTASADVTFVIGQNGTWHHNDQSWAGKEKGLSGWTSQSLVFTMFTHQFFQNIGEAVQFNGV